MQKGRGGHCAKNLIKEWTVTLFITDRPADGWRQRAEFLGASGRVGRGPKIYAGGMI